MIKDSFGIEPETETGGRGQLDIEVNGETVVSRKGGLLALLFRKPWPSNEEIVGSIKSAN